MHIVEDDLSRDAVRDLLKLHLAGMNAASPPGTVFALDLAGLKAPNITVWSAWRGKSLCGIGALKELDAHTGEVKSMRTHPDHLRSGVGAALLEHIIAAARARGIRKLSLETGDGPEFEAALSLYKKRGFVKGEPFADYQPSDFNQFFHLQLA
jgi:putative acetyltransferase